MSPQPLRYSDIQTQARDMATAALKRGDSPAQAARAVIDAAEAFLTKVVGVVGLETQMAAIQCGAGCYQCCHQMVGVTAAELELVRAAVDALPEPVRAETRARIQDIAERGKGLDQGGWWQARLRCALLDADGHCVVHADRPLPCRAMNSSDVSICRRSFDGERLQVPILAAQHKIHGHAQAGLLEALTACGGDRRMLALGKALPDTGHP